MAYVALRPLRRGGPVVSADRSGCWCANKRQPCSYHEGWGDAEDVCAVVIAGLRAELTAAYEDADRLAELVRASLVDPALAMHVAAVANRVAT